MTDPKRGSRALIVWGICLIVAAPVVFLVGYVAVVATLFPKGDDAIQQESAWVPESNATLLLICVVLAMLATAVLLLVIWAQRRRSDPPDT